LIQIHNREAELHILFESMRGHYNFLLNSQRFPV